ncbi:MAG: hypothetical protein IJ849_01780 [Selenomonadaceae bacterium]|nr:hypothetical protein [Selenomonadaceae bacterium]
MKIKAWLKALALGAVCWGLTQGLDGATAEAKELPTVVWTNSVYALDQKVYQGQEGYKENWNLLTDNGRKRIAEAITRKLKAQAAEGKLPFKVQESSRELNADLGRDVEGVDSPIGIVPIVTTDASFHTGYKVGSDELHRYIIIAALDIAFCSQDEGGTLRILANIPLHFYLNLPESNNPNDMKLLSRAEEEEYFTRFAVKMIDEHLDFSKEKRLLKNLEEKTEASTDTYQVTSVNISSKRAASMFGSGAREAYLKKIIGDVFSSAYARNTGHVVYPSLASGNWHKDAVTGLWRTSLDSGHSGEKVDVAMKEADNKITLDVTGVGSGEVATKKQSDVNGYMMYKVWLKKSPVEGKEDPVAELSTTEQFFKVASAGINKDEHDVFRLLLIDAAAELGNRKIK